MLPVLKKFKKKTKFLKKVLKNYKRLLVLEKLQISCPTGPLKKLKTIKLQLKMFGIHILCPAGHLKTIQTNQDFFQRSLQNIIRVFWSCWSLKKKPMSSSKNQNERKTNMDSDKFVFSRMNLSESTFAFKKYWVVVLLVLKKSEKYLHIVLLVLQEIVRISGYFQVGS